MGWVEQWGRATEFKTKCKDVVTYVSLDGGTDTLKNVYPKKKESKEKKKKIPDWKKPKTFLLTNFVKDASKVLEFISGRSAHCKSLEFKGGDGMSRQHQGRGELSVGIFELSKFG